MVRLPEVTLVSSAMVPVEVPVMAALSVAPVTVTSMVRLAEPSRLVTVRVSCTTWAALRAWVAGLVLSSA